MWTLGTDRGRGGRSVGSYICDALACLSCPRKSKQQDRAMVAPSCSLGNHMTDLTALLAPTLIVQLKHQPPTVLW